MKPDTIMLVHDVYSKQECEEIINVIPIAEERYVYNTDTQKPILSREESGSDRHDKQWDGRLVLGTFQDYAPHFQKLRNLLIEGVKAYGQKISYCKRIFS